MLLALAIIFILILINALYVAAEFATVGARRSRIRQLSAAGNPFAKRLLTVLEDSKRLDEYIAVCQIGITLSSLVLGAYGQAALAVRLTPIFENLGRMQSVAAQSSAAVAVLIGLTMLQMVLGELVPKSIALQYPNRTALLTALPMQWSLVAFKWFNKILNGSGIAILKLLGIEQTSHIHIHSPEEIEMLIAESREGGFLDAAEHERLRNALKLNLRTVKQLMVPRTRVAFIDVNTTIPQAIEIVKNSPFTRLPVYSGNTDTIVGLLHTKDLAIAYIGESQIDSLRSVMRPVIHVSEGAKADRLIAMLREHRTHQAIVVDEFGGIAGLVTLEDILAEILGETADEFKAGEAQAERLPDGSVRVPGHLRLDEASELLGSPLRGDTETISGLITHHLGHIPKEGDRVVINGLEFQIERVDSRAITSLVVKKINSIGVRSGKE